ncbi:MAG: hypothetical protein U9R66_05070, partial [Thermodesulfobacteriota bacterium]|nr:hypothetical protein [Thermodesulfobacteriota bacterium]
AVNHRAVIAFIFRDRIFSIPIVGKGAALKITLYYQKMLRHPHGPGSFLPIMLFLQYLCIVLKILLQRRGAAKLA